MKFNVEDLIEKKLVHRKKYTEGRFAGLSVLKYKNNVFWDNLWNTDSRLLDCRGMVVDSEDNIIIWPFTKIFNRFENNTDLPLDQDVIAIDKINGFMASVSFYNEDMIVATTGTLDSEFAKIATKHFSKMDFNSIPMDKNYTFIFEICDESDPHIVKEAFGAYLIGARFVPTGEMLDESTLDTIAKIIGCMRPKWEILPFGKVVENSKHVLHEGFVLRDVITGKLLLKIKSPHYLVKKLLARGSVKKAEAIWEHGDRIKKIIPEEYYPLLEWLKETYTKEDWQGFGEQERLIIIENYFGV